MNTPPLIEKDIPITHVGAWSETLFKMEPGDSIVVTITEASAVRTQALRHGMGVITRTIEPNKVRLWKAF